MSFARRYGPDLDEAIASFKGGVIEQEPKKCDQLTISIREGKIIITASEEWIDDVIAWCRKKGEVVYNTARNPLQVIFTPTS